MRSSPNREMWIEMVIDLRNPMRSQSSSAYGVIIEACGGKAPARPFGFNSVRRSQFVRTLFFMPFLLVLQARDMD